ncbi:ABC transporter substrate-binding protein [Listeria booriae]|uniref:ABC transporter substrate-binding protein n=1 Tax=Listeria booriae TaxID=1552123 RepID=A0A7X1C2E9_9LIST|nr:ABC transporter substrate-binding protein [Listeria booriae]MBC1212548.1 ABC transporter substrate-binding protein [Listeria booriae]MBC1235441.1 ABC transporter substrate-binding protein [Listeria booriae]MBC1248153.1 ABC transporter substrate-binding protein [Listeria booriae]MBC1359779.1 ABC transporter substrate-binding protein [Listeria booriae]MBC1554290.1 ABC transporter substrate-binding protein [Listeria booriae]
MKKKKFTALLLVVLTLGLVLAACGGGSSSSSDDEAKQEEKARTLTDALDRKVEVPATPKKIVAIQNAGELYALDIKPAATTDYYMGIYPDFLKGVENIGGDKPNVEKIAALKPDLIIISDYQKDMLTNLEKIAPVYATKFGVTPDDQLADVANLVNAKDAEKAYQKKYAKETEEAKATLKKDGIENQKAAVVQFWGKETYIHDPIVFGGLYDAGFTPTEAAKKNTETKAIATEAVPAYVGDADQFFILTPEGKTTDDVSTLLSGIWKDIPAVKAGHVYLVDNDKWSNYTAPSREYQMQDAIDKITKK